MSKKVLFIAPALGSGGSEKMLVTIANYIDINDYKVKVVLVNGNNQHYRLNKNIEVIDLDLKHIKQSFFKIYKVIKKEKPQIVFSTLTVMNVVIALISYLFPKTKFIARESTIVSMNNRLMSYRKLLNFIIKIIYRNFDVIVAQSKAMKTDLINNFGVKEKNIIQIYNPIKVIELIKNPNKTKSYKFISVGNLRKEKGYIRILESLKMLKIPYTYTILGDGAERKEIEKFIYDNNLETKVVLKGRQPNPYDYLLNSDLYLSGSYYEGFPNALLEAGLCRLPVIAYNAPGGISEILTSDSGVLVEDGNKLEYKNAILEAIDKKWNYEMIRSRITKEFDYSIIMKEYLNLFNNV